MSGLLDKNRRKDQTLLIVDDDLNTLRLLEKALKDQVRNLITASDGSQALHKIAKHAIDILITDYQMPGMNGLELLHEIRLIDPGIVRLMMSAYADKEMLAQAIHKGDVYRFIFKPWEKTFISDMIEDAAAKRESMISDLTEIQRQLDKSTKITVMGIAEAIEMKDPYTKGHCGRVRDYSILLARARHLSRIELTSLVYAALLHDCGKSGTSESLLLYQGPLDMKQRRIMERHPIIGYEMLAKIPRFESASPLIRQHHERWDGKGYPDGLMGEDISVGARIIAITDAFDAMTSDRPYRKAMRKEDALRVMKENSGTQFDPDLMALFEDIINSISLEDFSILPSPGKPQECQSINALIVSNDSKVNNAIARLLFDVSIHVFKATASNEAVELMKKKPIDVIIAGHLEDSPSNVEFLRGVKKEYPESLRILLSNDTDINTSLNAINNAEIYLILLEPWNEKDIKTAIYRGLEWKQLVKLDGI